MSIALRPSSFQPAAIARGSLAGRPEVPSRLSAILFRAKVMAHRTRRALLDSVSGPRRLDRAEADAFPFILAESRSRLWSDERDAERAYQLGKVHNLRLVARAINGTQIPAGEVFSFWKQVGRPGRDRGFVVGRMLQQGCLVPAIGGGICQLSNALYDVALQSRCEIVERHGHSRVVPGSAAAMRRDATVAWNYVDLRFHPRQMVLVEALLTPTELIIRFRGQAPLGSREDTGNDISPSGQAASSCATCDQTQCFR